MSSNALGFEKLLEAVPDALVGMDQKGVIRFVNRQAELLFGYDRYQLVGEPIDTLVPEPLWQIYAEHRQGYFEDRRTRSSGLEVELSGRHHDGGDFPINVTLSQIDTGDVLVVIKTVREVTQQQQAVRDAGLTAAIVEHSDDAIMSCTLDGTVTSWNPAAERLFGYSAGEIIGRSGLLVTPDDRLGEVRERLAGIRTGHHIEHLETTCVRKDGTLVPVSVNSAPIYDEDGTIVGVSVLHRDVTEQRRAFEAARYLSAIVEDADDAIIGSKLDGTITSWNPAAERMYGYSSEEIVDRPASLLLPEDRAQEIDALVAEIKAGGHIDHLETVRVRKDGTPIPVSLTISPIRDADGAVTGASVIARDMTEERQAARALAAASQRFRLVAENASDVVVLTNPDREVTWVSPSVTGTLGWAAEDLLGTRPADLIHPDDLDATAAVREVLYSGQHPATPEGGFLLRIRTKSGGYRWMSTMGTPVADESGAFVGIVGGWRDVDELVRTREAAKAGEATLRATMDSLLDPHVLLGAVRDESGQIVDFVYVDANPAACAYNRIDYQDLVGARLLDLQPGTVGHGLLEQYRHVVESGEPLVLEDAVYAQERLGGQERRYDVRATRVGDGLSYTWRDVTDRHAAARWLAESEEHFRLLAENASDVVMRLSWDRRFEWVSGSIGDVLGWAAPDLLGQMIDEFIHPEERALFRHAVAETSPESTASTEFRFRRSDGSYRWVLCHTRLKPDGDDTPVALVGGLVDIDARKEVEAQEQDRLDTLERFQRLTLGRELKMIELKKEIETLRRLVFGDGGGEGDKR